MRKSAKSVVNRSKPKQRPHPLQVRVDPDIRKKLQAAADNARRSLAREMELRLSTSIRGDHSMTELFPGWSPEEQLRFHSLGNVIALLCQKVTQGFSVEAEPHNVLKPLRVAVNELLDSLSASIRAPKSDVFVATHSDAFFKMITGQLLAEMRQASNIENPTGEKAALAEFANAWGVKG